MAGSEANLISNGIDSLYAPPIDLSGNQANIHKGYLDQTEPTGGYFHNKGLDGLDGPSVVIANGSTTPAKKEHACS